MMIGFKTKVRTNNAQNSLLTHWSNARRYAYNYALALSLIEQETLPEGEKWKLAQINEYDKYFNQGKIELGKKRGTKSGEIVGSGIHTWLQGIPGSVGQLAIKYDLKSAWQRCFKKLGGRPKFQSKYRVKSFKLSNSDFKKDKNLNEDGSYINHNRLGEFKLGDKIPKKILSGKLMNTTFSKSGKDWYVAFIFEIPDEDYFQISKTRTMCVGVDLGVAQHATCYDEVSDTAWHEDYPKENLKVVEDRIRILQRKMSKCKKGSLRYKKLSAMIAQRKSKQGNIRQDACHKLTKKLSTKAYKIVLEDLKVSNMTKSAKGSADEPGKNVKAKSGLNREILNMSLHSVKMQLGYKTIRYGSELVLVNPAYTSQTCSCCGHVSKENRKTQAKFICVECGHSDNADINAAKNILKKGLNSANSSVE